MMKKIKNRIVIIIVISILLSLLSGCTYFYPSNGRYHDSTPSLIQQKEIELNLWTVKKGDIFEAYEVGADGDSHCIYVNDPKKTTIVKADIEPSIIKKTYVKENDYVEEGEILIEYIYEMDKDTEFKYNISKRRAELRYENAYMQYLQGKISKEILDSYNAAYVSAKNMQDEFYALEEKYVLRAPCSGYIAKIVGDIMSTDLKQNISFHICEMEDGLILLYAPEANEIAAYPFLIFTDGLRAKLYDNEAEKDYDTSVKMSNMTFNKEYSEYLNDFYGSGVLYMVLEIEGDNLPDNIGFNKTFTASLIKREAHDILLVAKYAVDVSKSIDSNGSLEYYVYKMTSDETLERVQIKVGAVFDNYYEVKEGLLEGDMVLIK